MPHKSDYYRLGSDGLKMHPTKVSRDDFNAEEDCKALYEAMRGLGTDENKIVEVLGHRSLKERLEIKHIYKTMYGKDLIDELDSEIGGKFHKAVEASLRDPTHYDAICLHKAMKGAGTTESTLTEILATREPDEIQRIKESYKKHYDSDLEEDIKSETSGYYRRVLISCLEGGRHQLTDENWDTIWEEGLGEIIDNEQAETDAAELLEAGKEMTGTNEVTFMRIFSMRNIFQLRAVFREYYKMAGCSIIETIESETSGDFCSILKAIARYIIDRPGYYAHQLYKSMKGLGTDDERLIQIIVTRSNIDLADIKKAFFKENDQTLEDFIADDLSGDYKHFILALTSQD